jgi:hypothetical protein
MKKKLSEKVGHYSTSSVFLATGILLWVIFFFLWIYPIHKSLNEMDVRIEAAKEKMKVQERLLPFYLQLKTIGKDDLPDLYPVPEKHTLPRYQIETVQPAFEEIARKSGMGIVSVDPDIIGLENKPGLLKVDLVIHGEYFNFRSFLIELAKMDYLEKLEKIQVRQTASYLEFTMKILLSVS